MADRVVQSLWVGDRLSRMGQLSLQSFLDHGHDCHLYCYDPIDGVPPGVSLRDAAEILPRGQVFAYHSGFGQGSYSAGSNYFRYKLLLDRGGWWIDTDVVCLQPFDFTATSVLASEWADPDEGGGTVAASSVIRQPPGSALMRWTWRKCRELDPVRVLWGQTGPRLMQEGVTSLGLVSDLHAPSVFSPVPFFDWRALIDGTREFAFGPEVHAVHLWHQMWKANGVDPNGNFPAASLYERFKRRHSIG